jgi:hypothetical protein
MSLINDALKKAQKQRTGEAPPLASMPSIGGESPARIAKRSKPAGFNTLLLRLGLGAGALLVVVVIGAYFAFRSPRGETAAPPPPTVAPAAPRPDAPVVGQAKAVGPSSGPAPSFNLPIASPAVVPPPAAPAQKSTPQPVTVATPPNAGKAQPTSPVAKTPDEPSRSSPVSSKPGEGGPSEGGPVPAAPAARMEGKSVAYIENLRIAGIRASATDAKVLMNDRVYRIGDMVEHELGLKLVGITSSSLAFEDERGARYTRSF